MDDEYWHGAVMQDVMAGAAEQRRTQGPAASRAHDHQVVVALLGPAYQSGLEGLAAEDGGPRDIPRPPLGGSPQTRLGLLFRISAQPADRFARRAEIGHRRRSYHR